MQGAGERGSDLNFCPLGIQVGPGMIFVFPRRPCTNSRQSRIFKLTHYPKLSLISIPTLLWDDWL
jgi:hypothetical protein